MRQLEPKVVSIGEANYYIFPFNAFYAANLSGEILALVSPIIAGLLPLFQDSDEKGESIVEQKIEDALPALTTAFNNLSGDKIETLMKRLLINQKNVSVEYEEDGETHKERLTQDLVNELFCMDIGGMYRLAFEVIKLNYGSFFAKAPSQFGNATEILKIMK